MRLWNKISFGWDWYSMTHGRTFFAWNTPTVTGFVGDDGQYGGPYYKSRFFIFGPLSVTWVHSCKA